MLVVGHEIEGTALSRRIVRRWIKYQLTMNFLWENTVEDFPLLLLFFPSHFAKLFIIRGVVTKLEDLDGGVPRLD